MKLKEIKEREKIEHERILAEQEALRAAGEARRRKEAVAAQLAQAFERQQKLAAANEKARLAAFAKRE